jgi:phosphoglycerate dehydrogenase-like enzyme
MTVVLVSRSFARTFGAELEAAARAAGLTCELLLLPEDPAARLSAEECARVEVSYFSGDIFPVLSRSFFSATAQATNLRWLHVFNAGVDNPVFRGFLDRGVRLTTSSGSTAKPIAQTAIGGMLMLARGFPRWAELQRRHAWEPARGEDSPADLDGQTMVVFGVGAIGNEVSRLARAIGLHVVGVRRSPARDGDHVDEMHPPAELPALLPRADWLVLACPLTGETRGVIDEAALEKLPTGARVINVARGEVVDEAALIRALQAGQVGGAYLDVFAQEPLPAESLLWDLPNVIISPHNSAVAAGNEGRAAGFFLRNLQAWAKGEPMENEASL